MKYSVALPVKINQLKLNFIKLEFVSRAVKLSVNYSNPLYNLKGSIKVDYITMLSPLPMLSWRYANITTKSRPRLALTCSCCKTTAVVLTSQCRKLVPSSKTWTFVYTSVILYINICRHLNVIDLKFFSILLILMNLSYRRNKTWTLEFYTTEICVDWYVMTHLFCIHSIQLPIQPTFNKILTF